MANRREFIKGSAAIGLGLGLGGVFTVGCGGTGDEEEGQGAPGTGVSRAEKSLRILILGGTAFLGPAEVEYALARGHQVTLFNRGQTNPHLFPEVEKLVGDRALPDYSALEGREWDAVIDNSANVASWLVDATAALKESAGRYLFVSSISAFKDTSIPGMTEDGPVFTEDDPEHKNGAQENPIRIPAGFWKVISVELAGTMRSAGFLVWQRDYDSEVPLPFAPVLEQVRLTTIEVLTGLTFPASRLFDPLLFDQQARTRARSTSRARERLRTRALGAADTRAEIGEELLIEATSPGTAAITSMRDIVL